MACPCRFLVATMDKRFTFARAEMAPPEHPKGVDGGAMRTVQKETAWTCDA